MAQPEPKLLLMLYHQSLLKLLEVQVNLGLTRSLLLDENFTIYRPELLSQCMINP